MRSFKKVIIATLVMGTLSSAGAALAAEGAKGILPKLRHQERRPVAQMEKPKPPVKPEDQQRVKRPEPPKDRDGKRLEPPKDGKRRPPVSGDIRKGDRPEPPKGRDGKSLPHPDGKRPEKR